MSLRDALAGLRPGDPREEADIQRVLEFVARHPRPFDRRIAEGHLTGSAFVVSADGRRVLLLHHRKLARWLQPGGHAEGDEDTGEAVALREALEETGIAGLALHPAAPRPLDVDVHVFPARGPEPAHDHLDLRYLLVAPAGSSPEASTAESTAARWFSWPELAALDLDHGLCRGLAKARELVAQSAG